MPAAAMTTACASCPRMRTPPLADMLLWCMSAGVPTLWPTQRLGAGLIRAYVVRPAWPSQVASGTDICVSLGF